MAAKNVLNVLNMAQTLMWRRFLQRLILVYDICKFSLYNH